jgi:hypothetical protein
MTLPLSETTAIGTQSNVVPQIVIDECQAIRTLVAAQGVSITSLLDKQAIQRLVASGVVTAGVQALFLDFAGTAIAATIASAINHKGFFLVKASVEPSAGKDCTVTITTGTWNGTNKVATFADVNDLIIVYFDEAGNGTVVINTGSVTFS